VALKFLHDTLSEEYQRLFEREAKALAALSKHPSIVQIHAWGEYSARNYFVLEYVELSVQRLLEQSPGGISMAFALQIAAECAEALAYAHQQGILHRDVKPANILVEAAGQRAKLADFGIARFCGQGSMTLAGRISGSPPYMSPEQASGKSVDERSDIFSLGVTLYEMLSGKRPFEGPNSEELMQHIRDDVRIPLSDRRPDLPPLILDIVDKATAHDPSERFPSAESFAQELRVALGCVKVDAPLLQKGLPRTPSPRRLYVRWAVRMATVGVLGTLIVLLYTRGGRDSSPMETVSAEATQKMDAGDAAGAEALYRAFLEERPEDPDGLYGLGYSLLRQGKTADAEAAFVRIADEPLRAEGTAAAAFEREGEKARPQIEAAADVATTAYPKTMLANLDVAKGDYQEAVERLQRASQRFYFGWQRGEYLRALGQALFHLGDYANALKAFEELSLTTSPGAAAFANAYIEMARGKNDEARRAAIHERAQNIRKLMNETQQAPDSAAADTWTSRPLRFCLLPAKAGSSRIAAESGLADVVPLVLGEALTESTPMLEVDRKLIEEILAEQELSGQLSSGTGKLRLGQILGARLLIECSFESVFQKEYLSVKVVDVETTHQIGIDRADVTRSIDLDTWMKGVAGRIWKAVSEAYPIRGKVLHVANGLSTNIGAAVGVKPGMRFLVSTQPDARFASPNRFIVIEEPVGETSASARTEGFAPDQVPPEGLYITVDRNNASSGTA
jgi:tetratricopeptide (TPR) repeat protein